MGGSAGNGNNLQTSWVTAQAVIVGLVITEALKKLHENIEPVISSQVDIKEHLSYFDWSVFLTFFIFLLLLVRFYLGALRFSQIREDDGDQPISGKIVDGIGATILFTFFFFMAASLDEAKSFIKYIFLLHLADLIWFAGIRFMARGYKKRTKVSNVFLVLTIITLVFFFVIKDTNCRMIFLIFISIVDFVVLSKFYLESDVKFVWEWNE